MVWIILAHYRPAFLDRCIYCLLERAKIKSKIVICLNQANRATVAVANKLKSSQIDVFHFKGRNEYEIKNKETTISTALNEVIHNYDSDYYVKFDEDCMMLDDGIEQKILDQFYNDPYAVSALCNLNDFGGWYLTKRLGWSREYKRNFGTEVHWRNPGPFMSNDLVAEWILRKTIDYNKVLKSLKEKTERFGYHRYGPNLLAITKKNWKRTHQEVCSEEWNIAQYFKRNRKAFYNIALDTFVYHLASFPTHAYLKTTDVWTQFFKKNDINSYINLQSAKTPRKDI